MLIENGKITKHFIEPDKEGDPFEVSDADTMLKFINKKAKIPDSVTIFTKKDCPFCKGAKELLKENWFQYSEIELGDATRQKVLHGITGNDRPTVPQIFINGELIGGLDKLKIKLTK
jgi:peroxiredoxin